MSTVNPFPLEVTLKVNSPQLLAWLAQYGDDKFVRAEDLNQVFQALQYLYENSGSGGGSLLFLGDHPTLQALQDAYPNPVPGNTANIIVEAGPNDLAVWDNDDSNWIIYPGAGYSFSIPSFQEVTDVAATTNKDVEVNTLDLPYQSGDILPIAGKGKILAKSDRFTFIFPDGGKFEAFINGAFGNGTIRVGLPTMNGQARIQKIKNLIPTGNYVIQNTDTDQIIECSDNHNLTFTNNSLSVRRDFEIYNPSTNTGTVTISFTGCSVVGYSTSSITLASGFIYRLYHSSPSNVYYLFSTPEAGIQFTSQNYVDNAITQLINGAPTDANTLKELNDKIIAINAIIGGTTADGDSVVNTVAELLNVFQTYPEGSDIATILAGKINSTNIINNLTQVVTGKVLDAAQGKVLKDLIDTLTTTVTANSTAISNKVDKELNKSLVANTEITKLSYITITQDIDLDAIETRVNELDAAVILKGTWNPSGNPFPGGGNAQAGWSYLVIADGIVDGVEFKNGDRLICVFDNASATQYIGNWYKADYTDRINTVAGRTGNVVITSSDLSDFNSAVNALITTAIGNKVDKSSVIVKSLSSNFSTTSSTNANTNLSFPIGANEVWFVAIDLEITTGTSTTGMRYQISAPAGAVVEGSITGFGATSTVVVRQRFAAINTQLAALNTGGVATLENRGFIRMKNGATPGTVSIGCASNSNGTASTILAGSTIIANKSTEV